MSDASITADNTVASNAPIVAPEPRQDSQPTELNGDASTSDQPAQSQPLSKKAQKRLAKEAFLREKNLKRRQRERAAKKEKRRRLKERRAAGELDNEEDPELLHARKRARKAGPVEPFKARVVIDLAFDNLMSDKEIISLSSQLAYCYSANRKAACPFEIILCTSLEGRLRTRLERENNAGYKRWAGCEWWEESYERLWADDGRRTDQSFEAEDGTSHKDGERKSTASKDKVVYLTADADEELEELKEGETYILGGIVDRNRHKSLCQKKAQTQGIRTAQLPIGRYLKDMKSRKVLTINQVFEILVHWTESRNWEEALYSVMPKRKFVQQTGTPQEGGKIVMTADGEVVEEKASEEDASSEEEGDVGVRVAQEGL